MMMPIDHIIVIFHKFSNHQRDVDPRWTQDCHALKADLLDVWSQSRPFRKHGQIEPPA